MQEVREHKAIKKLVPKLRFKEFDAEWKVDRFDEFCILQRGFDLTNASRVEGSIPVYSSSGISYYHSDAKVNAPGIVTGRKGKVGSVFYVEEDFWPHDTALWVKDFFENDPKFIYWFLLHFKLERFEASSSVPTLNRNNVHSVKVSLPLRPEQQKIASFLSAVDEKIQQLTKKKELLEDYKKGVMQKLFSQQIRFTPTLDDVKHLTSKGIMVDLAANYPDWEEKRLGQVLTIGSGKDYKHLESGNIPVFGTGGYMLSVNDKLFSGETVFIGRKGTIDKPYYFKGDFWTVDTLFYTHKFKNVLPKFIYALFQQVNWKLYNEASGVPSLSKSTLEKIKFTIPVLEEQQKIAKYLSAIDAKIERVNQQITQTQTFKKGLLQQMFV